MSAYKVLGENRESFHGGTGKWQRGRWRSVEGRLVPCNNGIHYCRAEHLLQWLGPTIWLFEDGSPDETLDAGDKMVTRRGRIVEQTLWNDTTARLFAADCAEAVLHEFESRYPNDDRPRTAIAIARLYARGEIDSAARSAARSEAYWAARSAADSAADSAARSAADSAARSAAYWAARSAQTLLLIEYLEGQRP